MITPNETLFYIGGIIYGGVVAHIETKTYFRDVWIKTVLNILRKSKNDRETIINLYVWLKGKFKL